MSNWDNFTYKTQWIRGKQRALIISQNDFTYIKADIKSKELVNWTYICLRTPVNPLNLKFPSTENQAYNLFNISMRYILYYEQNQPYVRSLMISALDLQTTNQSVRNARSCVCCKDYLEEPIYSLWCRPAQLICMCCEEQMKWEACKLRRNW